jgi:hypothetical protein
MSARTIIESTINPAQLSGGNEALQYFIHGGTSSEVSEVRWRPYGVAIGLDARKQT